MHLLLGLKPPVLAIGSFPYRDKLSRRKGDLCEEIADIGGIDTGISHSQVAVLYRDRAYALLAQEL